MITVYKITPENIPGFEQGMYLTSKEDAERLITFLNAIKKPAIDIIKWKCDEIPVMEMQDCIATILKWGAGKPPGNSKQKLNKKNTMQQKTVLPNLEALAAQNFKKIVLKDPAVFQLDYERVMVREIRNYKGKIMCELETIRDKIMREIYELPEEIQQHIDARISLTV